MFDGRHANRGVLWQRCREMMHHLVVCLRRPRGPHDLMRTTPDQLCQPRARLFQRHVGAIAYPMRTRGVANELLRRLEPRLSCCGVQRGGGIMVEIKHVESLDRNIQNGATTASFFTTVRSSVFGARLCRPRPAAAR